MSQERASSFSQKITVGGTVHVMGCRSEVWAKRIETWNSLNPERAISEITGGATPSTRGELLTQMIERSGVSGHLNNMLLVLHTAICDLYVRRVSLAVGANLTPDVDIKKPGLTTLQDWVKKRYNDRAKELKFWITSDPLIGKHYSNSAWLLKNMRFSGWQPLRESEPERAGSVEFRGFCRQEPVTRLRQLLTFPLETFGIDMPIMNWPDPPTLEGMETSTTNLIDDSKLLQPALKQWEQYYADLTKKISEFELLLQQAV